jgi:transcriptional regulator with PAS, ATPase and Fis domain
MQPVFKHLQSLEGAEVPVLILGESGTGKELVARAIHARSPRKDGPFVTVNCAAIAEGLFESELFGHVRGSFTGAFADREGLLEAADGGTLFLDEVGELALEVQAKLLRVLQERRLRRVGAADERAVDVRILAATNRDLELEMREGHFRDDLYYRLAVFKIGLPPLRQRPSDVPAIVAHLLDEIGGAPAPAIEPDALQELAKRRWPGNVRELRNALERALTLSGGERRITTAVLDSPSEAPVAAGAADLPSDLFDLPFHEAKAAFGRLYARVLVDREGSVPAAVKKAGASRTTIYRLLSEDEAAGEA